MKTYEELTSRELQLIAEEYVDGLDEDIIKEFATETVLSYWNSNKEIFYEDMENMKERKGD